LAVLEQNSSAVFSDSLKAIDPSVVDHHAVGDYSC